MLLQTAEVHGHPEKIDSFFFINSFTTKAPTFGITLHKRTLFFFSFLKKLIHKSQSAPTGTYWSSAPTQYTKGT